MAQPRPNNAPRQRLTNRFVVAGIFGVLATTATWFVPTMIYLPQSSHSRHPRNAPPRPRVGHLFRGVPFPEAAIPYEVPSWTPSRNSEWKFVWPSFLFDALAWGLLPLACFELRDRHRRKRRQRRRKSGLCEACGYDLRGTLAPCCPERGKSFERNERSVT